MGMNWSLEGWETQSKTCLLNEITWEIHTNKKTTLHFISEGIQEKLRVPKCRVMLVPSVEMPLLARHKNWGFHF